MKRVDKMEKENRPHPQGIKFKPQMPKPNTVNSLPMPSMKKVEDQVR